MAAFRYSTSAGPGAVIHAADQGAAVRDLIARGIMPTSIEAAETHEHAPARTMAVSLGRAGLGRAQTASFIRELATALSAGLPLLTALRTISLQARASARTRILASLIEAIEDGASLADAAEQCGPPFTPMLVNLIRAGEASGRLDEVLAQAADLLDRDVAMRRSILSALLYPMILGVLIMAAIVIVTTFIVPSILAQVPIAPADLPLPTRIVRTLAMIAGDWWWVILPGVLVVIAGAVRVIRRPDVRMRIDQWLVRAPLLGPLLRLTAISRFTRTLATLTGAGLGIIPSLTIAKGTLGNRAIARSVDDITTGVAAGEPIAAPMERSGYFPPMLVQVVNLGERSGRLDAMLRQCAEALEARTHTAVGMLTTALPPILVMVMAVVVGFIVLAILLPLLQMGNTIMQSGQL